MAFNNNLRNARVARGLTSIAVADLLGVDKSTYSNYESGKREPDIARIKKLCEILGVSADYLLDVRPCLNRTVGKIAAGKP